MKKLFAFSLFVLASSLLPANADLLYFLVDSYSPEGPKYNFDYAVLGVAKKVDGAWKTTWGDGDSKVYLDVLATPDSGAEASKVVTVNKSGSYVTTNPSWADVSQYTDSNFSFFVETYKYGVDEAIWGYDETTARTYSQLLAADHVYTYSTSLQSVTPWVVPEPSGGMLLLLGLAGLALRRGKA